MKHTVCAVLVFFIWAVNSASAKTLFFLYDDSLVTFDHYNSEKVVQNQKISVKHRVSTSIVDFSKDDYSEISPYLIETGAFKKIMAIKVMKYSFYEQFTLLGRDYIEQSTGYFLIDSTAIKPIRQITLRSDNISNEYYDFNVHKKVPELTFKNAANVNGSRELKYEDVYTHEQLFWLVRFMAEMNVTKKELYLLPPMVNGLFSEKVYYAEIEFLKEFVLIQGVNTQKVQVTREDGKVAEFWVSLESSKRIFKAHNFFGAWYNIERSTVESRNEWPF